MSDDVTRLIREPTRDGRDIVGVWDIEAMPPEKLAILRQSHEPEYVYARDYDALAAQLAEARALLVRITRGEFFAIGEAVAFLAREG